MNSSNGEERALKAYQDMVSRYILSVEARVLRLEKRETVWVSMAYVGMGTSLSLVVTLVSKVVGIW